MGNGKEHSLCLVPFQNEKLQVKNIYVGLCRTAIIIRHILLNILSVFSIYSNNFATIKQKRLLTTATTFVSF